MNALMKTPPTMSSLEIVDMINEERKLEAEARGDKFTVLRHDHFMAKIEKHPGIDGPKFRGVYIGGNGQERPCYHLPKREAELMVMSESLEVQTRIYDRLATLEADALLRSAMAVAQLPNFNDPIASARAWADAKEAEKAQAARAAQLEHEVAELAPAVEALDRIVATEDTFCVTDAAKHLQVPPRKLRDFLLREKWMYSRQGKAGYVAYQDRIHSGDLVHKYGQYQDPETGERKTNAQVLVTSKGVTKLAKALNQAAGQATLNLSGDAQ